MRVGGLLFSIALVGILVEPCIAQKTHTIAYPQQEGVTLGTGWNLNGAEKTSAICVEGDEVADTGSTTEFRYERFFDTESLMTSLSYSIEAKAQGLKKDIGGSRTFSRTSSLTAEDISILAQYRIFHGPRFLVPKGNLRRRAEILDLLKKSNKDSAALKTNVWLGIVSATEIRLGQSYRALLARNPSEFRRVCGDGFVSSIVSGGILNIVFRFSKMTHDEKISVATTMSGSYGAASFSGNVKNTIDKFRTNNRLIIFSQITGTRGAGFAKSEADVNQFIAEFPKAVDAAPTNIFFIVRPYEWIGDFRSAIEARGADFAAMVRNAYRLRDLRAEILNVISQEGGYVWSGDVTVQSVRILADEIVQDEKKLQAQIDQCIERAPPCVFDERYKDHIELYYRSRLPAKEKDVAEHPTVLALRQKYADWQRKFAATPRCIQLTPPHSTSVDCKGHLENGEWYRLRPLGPQIEKDLTDAIRNFPKTSPIEVRYQYWIDRPLLERCQAFLDEPCVPFARMAREKAEMEKRALAATSR